MRKQVQVERLKNGGDMGRRTRERTHQTCAVGLLNVVALGSGQSGNLSDAFSRLLTRLESPVVFDPLSACVGANVNRDYLL
jgi:hypothetical protein